MYTGLSWTLSPLYPTEAKPYLSQLYLRRLSLAKLARLNLFKTPASAQASEKKHFHTEAELRLVSRACPDIRRVVLKLCPDSETISCLHLVEFQQLQHLEMWGGAFRQAQQDLLLEVIGPNLR